MPIPLRKADRVLTPEGVSWWQDWMDHAEPGDPWWDAIDYGGAAETHSSHCDDRGLV